MQKLIDACFQQDDKLYLCVSSPTIKDKPVSLSILLSSLILIIKLHRAEWPDIITYLCGPKRQI